MDAFSRPRMSRRKLLSRQGYYLAAMPHGDRVRVGAQEQEGGGVMPDREVTARYHSPGCHRPCGTRVSCGKAREDGTEG